MPKKPTPADLARKAAQLKALRDGCAQARIQPVQFFYCQSGPDSEPVLLVGKRIQSKTRPILSGARIKKFVRGQVAFEKSQFIFKADKPTEKFKKHLKEWFGKEYAPLKRASVIQLTDVEEDDEPDSDKPTFTEEIRTAAAKRTQRRAKASGDEEGYWQPRLDEVQSELSDKLEIVSNAEQSIATRLEDGSTLKVRPRLEKSVKRIERLIRMASDAHKEVLASPIRSAPHGTLKRWLGEYLEEATAIQDRLQEHLKTLRHLERVERINREAEDEFDDGIFDDGDGNPTDKPTDPIAAAASTQDTAAAVGAGVDEEHDALIESIGLLPQLSSAEVWIDAARELSGEIAKWLNAAKENPSAALQELIPPMERRAAAIQRGSDEVDRLMALEVGVDKELKHIKDRHQASNPRDALDDLIETESDLEGLEDELGKIRKSLQGLAKSAGEPQIFAGLLGRTSAMRGTIRRGLQNLFAAEEALKHQISVLETEEEMEDLETEITNQLSRLTGKSTTEEWLKAQREVMDDLNSWLSLSATLDPDKGSNKSLQMLQTVEDKRRTQKALADSLPYITQISPFQTALGQAADRLRALPRTNTDIPAARQIKATVDGLVEEIEDARGEMVKISGEYAGPLIFQGLLNTLGALDSKVIRLDLDAEDAILTAIRNARKQAGRDDLRLDLEEDFILIHKEIGKCRELSDYSEVLTEIKKIEDSLEGWLERTKTLVKPIEGTNKAARMIALIKRAKTDLPKIQSIEREFERRRGIQFSDPTAQRKEILRLHSVLNRLHSRLDELVIRFRDIRHDAVAIGGVWEAFGGALATMEALLEDLTDFEDRLYRIHYDQQGAAPDEKTTTQGGTLNLTVEEQGALNRFTEELLEDRWKEENEERRKRLEEPIPYNTFERELPDEARQTIENIARRMIMGRVRKFA